MKHRTRAFIAMTGTAFLLSTAGAAYAAGGSQSALSAHTPQSVAATSTSSATVSTKSGPLGTVLVNSKGDTLYLFQADKTSTSTCNGNCAKQWPPLTTTGTPTAGGGVNSSKLSTTTRSDGTKQVTYNGHPLYTFTGDSKAGQMNGQGLTLFGAKWYVVGTNGNAVTKAPSSTSSPGTGGY
ncbi:hypothetical protein [Streptomyces sp. NPDC020917]|uniref:hypothetical protein n=1 Tax=Streptomyces sp. NPDC020917 TaxID=3365102 RepID=UPI003787C63B